MPKITFVDSAGAARQVAAIAGETLMEAGVKADVPQLAAECGGACACATCHVYIDERFMVRTGLPSATEKDMLDFAESPVQPNSRLACQIVVTEDMDGLEVRTPEAQ